MIGSVPAFIANAWYFAMLVLMIGRDSPFIGDFGFILFLAGMSMWLADAWFGLVAVRLGVVSRAGALSLVLGAVAVVGMDRLGFVSPSGADPAIFGPMALIGVALNGLGWVLLGFDVATRRQRVPVSPQQD